MHLSTLRTRYLLQPSITNMLEMKKNEIIKSSNLVSSYSVKTEVSKALELKCKALH